MDRRTLEEQVAALEDGGAFVAWAGLRLLRVGGVDARGWLQDLVTADIATLEPSSVRRSLLLSPTGHLRADFHVFGMHDGTFLLAQREDQPAALEDLLQPYVLSSDVRLEPSSLRIHSVPGPWPAPAAVETIWSPSMVGDGFDLLEEPPASRRVRSLLLSEGRVEVSAAALETWRVRRGQPRFPVDLDEASLPAEGGLDASVDFDKGCFLGQESVAKVRNLGHPPRVVIPLRSDDPVQTGQVVEALGDPVGVVTSTAPNDDGGTAVLARVRWDAREQPLQVSGTALRGV